MARASARPPSRRPLLVLVAFLAALVGVVAGGAAAAGAAPGYDECEGHRRDAGRVLERPGEEVVVAGIAPIGSLVEVPGPRGIEHVASMEVHQRITEAGDLKVTETIVYDFGRTPDRHGIYRDLLLERPCSDRYDRRYPLEGLRVSSPTGAPTGVERSDVEGGVRLRIGDADRNVEGRHTYVIDYTLSSVLDPFAEHVELYWNVVGSSWTVPVFNARATVEAPGEVLRVACYAGRTGGTSPCGGAGVDGSVVEVGQGVVSPGQDLTVVVALDPTSVAIGPPVLEERWSLARAFSPSPVALAGATGLSVLLLGGLAVVGFHVGRDRRAEGSPVDVAFARPGTEGVPVGLREDRSHHVELAPPDGLRPAQVALVANEEVTGDDIAATIVDLAVRGHLRIEELDGGDDHRLVALDGGRGDLLAYERRLLDNLFSGRSTVTLSSLSQVFSERLAQVVAGVYRDGEERHWFADRPDKVRARWRLGGVVGLGAAGAVTWLLVSSTHLALLAVPLVVTALLVVLLAGRMPRRTPHGTGVARRAAGFRHFIEDSEAPRARWAEQQSIFTDYLPYAMVFGCADRWARTFAPLGAAAVATSGFYVGSGAFDPMRITGATQSFASAASRTLSSTPPSSSGSSGFSGGSSGGGGGGGGGGSW